MVFFYISKFTVSNEGLHNSSCHLSFQDITIDNKGNPLLLQAVLKPSKTNLFRMMYKFIYIGATDSTIKFCSVKVILSYLTIKGSQIGPHFITQKSKGFTVLDIHMFSTAFDSLLAELE